MDEFKKPLLPIAASTKSHKLVNEDNIPKSIDTAEKVEIHKCNSTLEESSTQNCPYIAPLWSSTPTNDVTYSFEVLKSGSIIEEIKDLQTKAYWSFGRFQKNDVELAHPTVSRFHAVLQYGPKTKSLTSDKKDGCMEDEAAEEGWYVYDLGSTHGTFVNKQRVPPEVFIRIRVGHMLRFGASTRSYILQGPAEDEEPESELSVSELKAKRLQLLEEESLKNKRLEDEKARNEECSWGMGDDADEETDLTHNPYAATNNEELFLDDPKKTLRGYFEREGLHLEYKCDEMSTGSFVCRVELPLDNENGRPIIAEVVHKGKKKDCVAQCALEACRILDRHGVLRQANQEPLKRRQKQQGSDSDDDEFWDRTGDVAKKKQRKSNCATNVTLTYEDLLKQECELNKELKAVVSRIIEYQEQKQLLKAQKKKAEAEDDLDSFMAILNSKENPIDKTEIKKLRLEEQRIKNEIERAQKLIKITKPLEFQLSSNHLNEYRMANQNSKEATKTRQLPMIGKRNQFSKFKVVKRTTPSVKTKSEIDSNQEETDDDTTESSTEKEIKPDRKLSDECSINQESDNHSTEMEIKTDSKNSDERTINKGRDDHTTETGTEKQIKADSKKSEESTINQEFCDKSNKTDTEIIASTTKKSPISEERDLKNATMEMNAVEENSTETESSELSKKRRHRVRQRGKRPEVDKDEEQYESSEKYAKWLPPENQTGDGFTELNKKFGY